MRILQVLRAPVGGLFRHVADLTRALSERGHDVGLVVDSLSGDAQTEAKLAALDGSVRLGIHRMPMPRVLGPGDLSAPFALRRLARRLDIELLHGHGAKGGFGVRLARIGSKRLAAVYTPHGGVLHFDGRTAGGAVFHTIEKQLSRATDAIVFESAFAQRTYAEKIAPPRCRSVIVHNGVAEPEFAPVPLASSPTDFVFVGELRTLKGIFTLLDALGPCTSPSGSPATLAIAGDGPEAEAVRAAIAAKGLTGRVTLHGVQPAREMFARGRCVVIPSHAESLPYVVLEALAAGRPVIATDVGGIPEIFGADSDALVPPADDKSLHAALQRAIDAPDRLEAQTLRLTNRVKDRFSLSRMTDAIEQLYKEVVHR